MVIKIKKMTISLVQMNVCKDGLEASGADCIDINECQPIMVVVGLIQMIQAT